MFFESQERAKKMLFIKTSKMKEKLKDNLIQECKVPKRDSNHSLY